MIKSLSTVPLAVSAAFFLVSLGHAPSAHAALPSAPLASGLVAQATYGTIKGRLVWGGESAPPQKFSVDKGMANKDPGVCAASAAIPDNDLVVDPKTNGVKFAFVYVLKPNGKNSVLAEALVAKTPVVEIDQKNCEFVPFATALIDTQSLLFKSSDPVNHNVHISPFTNPPFNVILAPNGQMTKTLVVEKRPIPLVCDIHPWMKGWIMVFDHPFFAVTNADGSFEIKGVPVGEQSVVVWQAKVGYVNEGLARGMKVTVKPDGTDLGEIKLDPAKIKK